MNLQLKSQVIITQSISDTISRLKSLKSNQNIVTIIEEDKAFSVNDAKEAISKAYLASEFDTIIILGAKVFSNIVQNKLLKIIEEPPVNTEFILVTNSKSTILPTIKSRLPIKQIISQSIDEIEILDIENISLDTIYEFSQKNKRVDTQSMKIIIQKMIKQAIVSGKFSIDKDALDIFTNAYRALDLGSPTQFVLNSVLLKLLEKKIR